MWLRVEDRQVADRWVRGSEVIGVELTSRAAYRDRPETYGVGATCFTHDRTTWNLASDLQSRTEAMSVIRRVLQLLASPPEITGLITVDGPQVRFEAFTP